MMKKWLWCSAWCLLAAQHLGAQQNLGYPIPATGISGIYEVMVGASSPAFAVRYFGEFGFRVTDSASLTREQALKLYGVPSALKSYRMQNGTIDSHGLLRLLVWENPTGPGVGYGEPETIGSRMSVMMTDDITRLYDVYDALRAKKEKWLPTFPYSDDLFGLNRPDSVSFFRRPVLVKENAVYGEFFNHVFFQRHGYAIPGYGTINPAAPLKTSEFTHHDWFIQVDSMQQLMYLQTALGLKAEKPVEADGDYLKGPKQVFMMRDGYSHYYQGFVSPNNICGKLKFFMPIGVKPDKSSCQKPGRPGITLHSLYAPNIGLIAGLLRQQGIRPGEMMTNEFGEKCFVFTGPEGATWQIIEKKETKHQPLTVQQFVLTNN